MIRRLLFLLGVFSLSISTYGQVFTEIGFIVGGTGYQGDLIEPPYRFQRTSPFYWSRVSNDASGRLWFLHTRNLW